MTKPQPHTARNRQSPIRNYMIWNEKALRENFIIWKREQRNPEALWTIPDASPVYWHRLLRDAVQASARSGVDMPPIYFPSPRLCEQFIDHCNQYQFNGLYVKAQHPDLTSPSKSHRGGYKNPVQSEPVDYNSRLEFVNSF